MSNLAAQQRIDMTEADAYAIARRHGASEEDARKVANRARGEAASDERNGRLFKGAGTLVVCGTPAGFRLYTYTGRQIDPLAEYGIESCSTLD